MWFLWSGEQLTRLHRDVGPHPLPRLRGREEKCLHMHTHAYTHACIHVHTQSLAHNTTQRMNAADPKIKPKSIPTYTSAFHPPSNGRHCIKHCTVCWPNTPSHPHTHTHPVEHTPLTYTHTHTTYPHTHRVEQSLWWASCKHWRALQPVCRSGVNCSSYECTPSEQDDW